jgi:hypothetical protein
VRLVFSLPTNQLHERFQFLLVKDHCEVLFHFLYRNLAFENPSLATLFLIVHFNFGYKLFKSIHFSCGKLMGDGVEVKRGHISAFTLGELSVQVF